MLPDFFLRLFIDDTIYTDSNIMDYLNKIKGIQLVHYSCQNFIANGFHRGTFGTLVRFFPMFDFKNNDAEHVIITDIDWHNDTNVENRMRIIRTYNNLNKIIEAINNNNNIISNQKMLDIKNNLKIKFFID